MQDSKPRNPLREIKNPLGTSPRLSLQTSSCHRPANRREPRPRQGPRVTPVTARGVLPDPHLPPPDKNYTDVWALVMAAAQSSKLSHPSTLKTATSGGEKGSNRYGEVLGKLGIDFIREIIKMQDLTRQFTGSDTPIPFSVDISDEHARTMAGQIGDWYLRQKPNEATLCHEICTLLFPGAASSHPRGSPEEPVIARIFEFRGPFNTYDLGSLLNDDVPFPFVRLTPKERLSGPKFTRTLVKKLEHTTPAERDLHTRADLTFLVDLGYSHEFRQQILRYETDTEKFPGFFSSFMLGAPFLTVEFKRSNDDTIHKAALYQWAVGAYINLIERMRINRTEGLPYIQDENIRHYGYLICGLRVEIWVMTVERVFNGNRRKSYLKDAFFLFPAECLLRLDLDHSEDLLNFCKWHQSILRWGIERYAKDYHRDVVGLRNALFNKTVLSYSDAVEQDMLNSYISLPPHSLYKLDYLIHEGFTDSLSFVRR